MAELNTLLADAVPLGVLVLLMGVMVYVLWRAQQRSGLDLANMLRDDQGKESGLRMAVLGSFAVTSWALALAAHRGTLSPEMWNAYLLTWSGAMVFVKAADRWNGQLPFTNKPGA